MAAESSSFTSIQTPAEQNQFGKGEDDSSSICSLSDNDDFDFSDFEIDDIDEGYEAEHMSYRDQMKYFEKHEDPPVMKGKTSDLVKRLLVENAKKTPAGREKLRQLKAKPVSNTRGGNDGNPEGAVADFTDLSKKNPSKRYKLQHMSRKKFWKHVNRYLEKSVEEPLYAQADYDDLVIYSEVIKILHRADNMVSRIREHLLEIERKKTLSLTIRTSQSTVLFPDTSHLEEVIDDKEFDELIDDYYDSPLRQNIG